MCFFKKKSQKPVITNNKFKKGDNVNFKYRDDVNPGIIFDVKCDLDQNIFYDIQIGGECPAIIPNIDEKDIFLR